VGWVLFRAEGLRAAIIYLKKMFTIDLEGSSMSFDSRFYTILIIAVFFSFWGGFKRIENWQVRLFGKEQKSRNIIIMVVISVILLIISVSAITSQGFNPFIYFRF
jgi:alginate O-acetyltransferase complex protein AlgI